MRNVHLISCVGVAHDLPLLPHFLKHYLGLGVLPENIHIIINAAEPGHHGLAAAEDIAAANGIRAPRRWIAPYTSNDMWEQRRQTQADAANRDDWVISADVDELHEYPARLPSILSYMERGGSNCAQGVFIDRLAPDGALAPVAADPSLFAQYPVKADVACTVRRGEEGAYWHGTVKLMLYRAMLSPRLGGHRAETENADVRSIYGANLSSFRGMTRAAIRFGIPFRVHHFKWTAALKRAVRQRFETKGASEVGSRYGRNLLGFIGDEDHVDLAAVPIMSRDYASLMPWRLRIAAMRRFSSRMTA
ncbi:MAG: glycosyltransferase family 2 protein [Pacificimonas sp.]|jgi:hypothetical protein|nr:glycosyltransferase family 2 protein [Pacificimonas sp.]